MCATVGEDRCASKGSHHCELGDEPRDIGDAKIHVSRGPSGRKPTVYDDTSGFMGV